VPLVPLLRLLADDQQGEVPSDCSSGVVEGLHSDRIWGSRETSGADERGAGFKSRGTTRRYKATVADVAVDDDVIHPGASKRRADDVASDDKRSVVPHASPAR